MRHDYELEYSYQQPSEIYPSHALEQPDHHHPHINPISTARRYSRPSHNIIPTSSPFHQPQQHQHQPFLPDRIAHFNQPTHISPQHNQHQHDETHVYENIPYYFGEDTTQLGCYPNWPSPAPTPHLWPQQQTISVDTPPAATAAAVAHTITDRPATLAFEYGGRTRLRSSIRKLSGGDLSSLDSGAPQSAPRTPSLPPAVSTATSTIKRTPCDSLTSDDSSYLSAKDEYHSSLSVSRSSSHGRVRFSPEAFATAADGSLSHHGVGVSPQSDTPLERRLSAKRSLFLRRESASPKLSTSLSPAS